IRLVGFPYPPLDEDLERQGASGDGQHRSKLVVGDGEAQAVDRHAKPPRAPGNPEVALAGDLEAAADAGAVDHGERRVPAIGARFECAEPELAGIALALLRVIADPRQLLDVRARRECIPARAAPHAA